MVDTVDSVRTFLPELRAIVVIDDGLPDVRGSGLPDDVTLLPPLNYPRNTFGGLWMKDCYGLKFILVNHPSDFILKLDADALVVASGLEAEISRAFADPQVGVAGVYRIDPSGGRRDSRRSPGRSLPNRRACTRGSAHSREDRCGRWQSRHGGTGTRPVSTLWAPQTWSVRRCCKTGLVVAGWN